MKIIWCVATEAPGSSQLLWFSSFIAEGVANTLFDHEVSTHADVSMWSFIVDDSWSDEMIKGQAESLMESRTYQPLRSRIAQPMRKERL